MLGLRNLENNRLAAARLQKLTCGKEEKLRHRVVEDPPSFDEGGKGRVVPGCAYCRKVLRTGNQYLSHLAEDVLPQIFDRLSYDPDASF